MLEDSIVNEVRKIRNTLSAGFNYDVHSIFEDLRKKQKSLGSRLKRRESRKKAEQAASPAGDSAPPHGGR